MAKPIKETPILTGSDAEHFAYSVEHPRAVTKEEVERALAVYEKLSKCSELIINKYCLKAMAFLCKKRGWPSNGVARCRVKTQIEHEFTISNYVFILWQCRLNPDCISSKVTVIATFNDVIRRVLLDYMVIRTLLVRNLRNLAGDITVSEHMAI